MFDRKFVVIKSETSWKTLRFMDLLATGSPPGAMVSMAISKSAVLAN